MKTLYFLSFFCSQMFSHLFWNLKASLSLSLIHLIIPSFTSIFKTETPLRSIKWYEVVNISFLPDDSNDLWNHCDIGITREKIGEIIKGSFEKFWSELCKTAKAEMYSHVVKNSIFIKYLTLRSNRWLKSIWIRKHWNSGKFSDFFKFPSWV